MELTTFVRKPFVVKAMEVTKENLPDLAKDIGKLREDDKGNAYIHVDRRIVPNVFRVYPGYWVTYMGDNIRCYSKKVFREQFMETTPEIDGWIAYINGDGQEDEQRAGQLEAEVIANT